MIFIIFISEANKNTSGRTSDFGTYRNLDLVDE